MKKIFFVAIFIFVFGFALPPNFSFAQRVVGISNTAAVSDDHTAREEAEGQAVWEKLQAKELTCKDLSDDNFGTLGEYFMGQMMGASHETMNNMMIQMMGEQGEEQTHVVMGKRLSGCDASAAFPSQGTGFIPMMQMMMGGWSLNKVQDRSSPFNNSTNNNMMNFGFGAMSGFGWLFMILWWGLLIIGLIALIRWLSDRTSQKSRREKTPLEILKERYAKSEIDKKEFEDKKKDLA